MSLFRGLMRNITVEEIKQIPTPQQKIEIVERKGIGHPDYICDSIMNQISIELCDAYLKEFGVILHHNIDKALLSAGEAEIKLGGGSIKKPMLLIIGDRATFGTDQIQIPVNEMAINTAKKWFKENMRFVDPEEHVKYQIELKKGSAALTDIFKRKGKVLGANDTSAAVGYAPFTPTENLVFDVERFLNSKDFKKEFPESGEDIKVMGLRNNNSLSLTVAMAFVDKLIDSEYTYFKRKEEMTRALNDFLSNKVSFDNTNVIINNLDQRGRGIDGMYLTVTGTSADSGDCGQVGRGNRVNGVISLNRPASEEAAAGKNPVSHVGKIYNLLSFRIADEIYDKVSGIQEVYVWLLSQIGRPIDDPKIAAAQLVLEDNTPLAPIQKEIQEVMDKELSNIDKFCMDLAKGKIAVC